MTDGSLLPTLCVGNWKAHGSAGLLRDWAAGMAGAPGTVVLCVPHPLLPVAVACLDGIGQVGAQDVAPHGPANQTGNTTAALVADSGVSWTLVGHSERRALGETDVVVAAKLGQAIASGLRPILCVGESLEQREQGALATRLASQLAGALAALDDKSGLVVAYEPVWAIGTGVAARAEDAQQACALLRGKLREFVGDAKIQILYGGSVNPANAAEFMVQEDINGLLVGGASLDSATFAPISALVAQPQ